MKKYIGLVVFALFLSAVAMKSDDKPKLQTPVVIGRYQLYVPLDHIGLAVLLDTATGKTWHEVKYDQVIGEPSVWVPTGEKLDSSREIEMWESKQMDKPKQK
jgi:hypothetical protein